MIDVEAMLRPWLRRAWSHDTGTWRSSTRTPTSGANDPTASSRRRSELLAALGGADARAVVFPMHEPDGYPAANDVAIRGGGRARRRARRVLPRQPARPARSPRRAARWTPARVGIKLHPRAEQFALDEPAVRDLVALAHEREAADADPRRPRDPGARPEHRAALRASSPTRKLILAHCAISDLAWLWRVLPDHPNVLIDTAWWTPGRPDRPVHARAAGQHRVGERLALRAARSSAPR